MNEKHKLLISTDMVNSWREHSYCTKNTGNLSVAHTGIGLEVHNEEVNICSRLSRTMQDRMTVEL